jgi:hypothetical protein
MGATLIADDLHDRVEVIDLLADGDPEGGAALGSWTLSILWMYRNKRAGIPAERLWEVRATPAMADRLVASGLWAFGDSGYKPASRDRFGHLLWKREPQPGKRPSRPTIPADVRAAVFDRDGRACVECGAREDLALDHIYPWSLGGPDTVENLRVLCRSCNSKKGARV